MAHGGLVLLLATTLVSLSNAHIHSQKVSGLNRSELSYSTWVYALFSSALVGACGIFPLVLNKWIRLDVGCKESLAFKLVLSFAVGGLLGDVFLHLLPESYGASQSLISGNSDATARHQTYLTGLWVLIGVITFLAVEKLLLLTEGEKEDAKPANGATVAAGCASSVEVMEVGNMGVRNSIGNGALMLPGGNYNSNCNAEVDERLSILTNSGSLARRRLHPNQTHSKIPQYCAKPRPVPPPTNNPFFKLWQWFGIARLASSSWFHKDASGYLNLVANCTDNFTHGLAIAAAYVVSPAVGALTTLAILCHEVPHEVGDFAILLNSGFSLREAAKAQVVTASGGFVGVVVGLAAEQVTSASTWLLPFTAGGFLYISLVSILPDLLEETAGAVAEGGTRRTWWWPFMEVAAVALGVIVMALVTIVEKKSCSHVPAHFFGGT